MLPRAFPFIAVACGISCATALAHAQQVEPNLCNPAAPPTPGCRLAPPGQPPVVTPQEMAAYRAKVEADFRRSHGPAVYERAWSERDIRNHQAWMDRAEAARPADIPVAFPTVEATAGFRLGTDLGGRELVQVGPEVGFTFRINRTFAIDAPVALMQSSGGGLGNWATIAASPALVVSHTGKGSIVYARGGPDILVPRGASGVAPNAMVGGHLGIGVIGFVASLPNYGYVGAGFESRLALRGGIGGPSSVLDPPRFGLDTLFVVRLAF